MILLRCSGRGRGGREPLGPRGSRGMWEDQSRRIWKGSHPTSGSEFTRDVERLQPGRLTRPGGTGAGDPCDSMLAAPPPYNPFSASDFPALPLNPLLPSQPNHLHQAASIRLTVCMVDDLLGTNNSRSHVPKSAGRIKEPASFTGDGCTLNLKLCFLYSTPPFKLIIVFLEEETQLL